MPYTRTNFKTKKALVAAFNASERIYVFQPGPFGPNVPNGETVIEGPHHPEPHKFYVRVYVEDGLLTKILK
jgi:hypothetical protein